MEGLENGSMKNLLFCYINPSSGHQQAAEAVMAALRRKAPGVHCDCVNSISYTHPFVGRLVSRLYLGVLKHAPQLWEALYDNTLIEEATRDMRDLLSFFSLRKIARVIRSHRPRAVVCTQAVPLNVLSALKARGRLRTPLVGIVTDFGVHAYWPTRHVDLYLVPTEEIRRKLMRAGAREGNIRVAGIPVDPAFSISGDPRREKIRWGLDPRRLTVLVMGGSHGLGPLEDVVDTLLRLPCSPQIVAVCGNNRRLLRALARRFSGNPSILPLGHTRLVSSLMTASDLLVSKPGGLTTAEALAKGLPMVIVRPIPGQEEWNSAHLLRHGAAVRVESLETLGETVQALLTRRDRRERMRERCLALARPRAADDAAEAILSLIGEPAVSVLSPA
jgi:processive 1,2-diacylglycerol beta-glucosyltransferase